MWVSQPARELNDRGSAWSSRQPVHAADCIIGRDSIPPHEAK